MSKHFILLFCIILLGAAVRFVWLDRTPHSINGDELHYLISSKAFVLTGRDITQAVTPWDILLFHYPPTELVQAELPYFLNMVSVGVFPFSLTASAFPYALLSLGIIIFMYLVAKKLFNPQIGLISAFLASINPWFIVFGRTSYEMIPATFFYLCSLYVLLVTKGWRVLWALPLLLLAFYSYIATKLIFLPFVFLVSVFCYFVVNKKRYGRQYTVLLMLVLVFVAFFLFQLHSLQQTARTSELLTPSAPAIVEQVDNVRKIAIASPLLSLFENKVTIFIKILFTNIFQTLSPDFLFMHGDYFFSLGKHGLLYLIDPLFLIIGGFFIYRQKKNTFYFFLFFAALAILPQIIHNSSLKTSTFSPHITLLVPLLLIVIAAGISQIITYFKSNRIIISLIVVSYFILFGNFINFYFFELPLQHNYFNFPDRVLAKYITLNQAKNIHVYTQDARGKFQQYLFYSNAYNNKTQDAVTQTLKNKHNTYALGNVTFSSCDKSIKDFKKNQLIIMHAECDMKLGKPTIIIPQLSDSGGIFKILNDDFCSNYDLQLYVSHFKMHDFAIDRLSPETFCKTFIIWL